MVRPETEQRRRLAGTSTQMDRNDGETEIDLIELFYRLLENVKYIILATILCGIAAGIYTFGFQTPQYQATAKLYVTNQKDSAINLSDLQIGSYLTSDYQEVFKTWEVHEMVIKNLALPYTYTQMQSMLTVTNPKDTRILHITVTSDSPKEAEDIANEYALAAQKHISDVMDTEEPNVLSKALLPTVPVSPNKTRTVLLGLILGAFLSMGIITVQFLMDDKIKTADDIAKYAGLATLAIVPTMKEATTVKKKDKPSNAAKKR